MEGAPRPERRIDTAREHLSAMWSTLRGHDITGSFAGAEGDGGTSLITPGAELADVPQVYVPPDEADKTGETPAPSGELLWPTEPEEPPEDDEPGERFTMPTDARPLKEIFEQDLTGNATAHLVLLRGNDNVIVRYSPPEHHKPDNLDPITYTPSEAEKHVHDTLAHHKLLAGNPEDPTQPDDIGIAVPHVYYEVHPKPDGTAYITSITERVYGTPFRNAGRWYIDGIDPSQRDAAIRHARGLLRYYGSALTSGADTFLHDIHGPDQALITDGDHTTILDTDPSTISLRTGEGQCAFVASIGEVKLWTADAGLGDLFSQEIQWLLGQFEARFPVQ